VSDKGIIEQAKDLRESIEADEAKHDHYATIYRTTFYEDDVLDGEIAEGTLDYEVIGLDPDEWEIEDDLTTIDLAVSCIEEQGLGEGSSSQFHAGLWYVNPDGSYIINHYSGEREESSLHLGGFSEDEQRRIYERVKGTA
jgi:hypothetical protein